MAAVSAEAWCGNGNPMGVPVIAIGSLPTASSAGAGAMVYVTGTAHATVTSQLAVSDGTNWKYAEDGITTIS